MLSTFTMFGQKTLVFVGSFTGGKPSPGITVYEFNYQEAKLTPLDTVFNVVNPSYLTLAPSGKELYALTEADEGSKYGKIHAFKIDTVSGKVKFINSVNAGSKAPVHLEMSKDGKHLVNSNYTPAGVGLTKIQPDGSLTTLLQYMPFTEGSKVHKDRQDKAYMHSANFTPDGNYIVTQDLGADKMHVFELQKDAETPLQYSETMTVATKPGSGPRHFTFHPNGKFGYGITELDGSINAYTYNGGNFVLLDSYPSYKGEKRYGAADIRISPDGKFLYGSNRVSENTLVIYEIDQTTGLLTLVGHQNTGGEHPRNFSIDPTGKYIFVANQFTDNVVIFERNKKTGKLTPLPNELQVNNPACLQMHTYQ